MGMQVFLVQLAGSFVSTTPLNLNQWLITIALGALSLPLGWLSRFIPVEEDPNSFFNIVDVFKSEAATALGDVDNNLESKETLPQVLFKESEKNK